MVCRLVCQVRLLLYLVTVCSGRQHIPPARANYDGRTIILPEIAEPNPNPGGSVCLWFDVVVVFVVVVCVFC